MQSELLEAWPFLGDGMGVGPTEGTTLTQSWIQVLYLKSGGGGEAGRTQNLGRSNKDKSISASLRSFSFVFAVFVNARDTGPGSAVSTLKLD